MASSGDSRPLDWIDQRLSEVAFIVCHGLERDGVAIHPY